MADDENTSEIDLYGNIDEDEFRSEDNDLNNEDLYDEIITDKPSQTNNLLSSVKSEAMESDVVKPATAVAAVSSHTPATAAIITDAAKNLQSSKRFSTYLGNLTWWTSDQDILQAFKSIGIDDIVEIKFHENRLNGQSKGFCVVVFTSDTTAKLAMEKIPQIEIHSQKPMMTYCNRQNLVLFEKMASGTTGNFNDSNGDGVGSSSGGGSSGGNGGGSLGMGGSGGGGISGNNTIQQQLQHSNSHSAALAYNSSKSGLGKATPLMMSGSSSNSLLPGPPVSNFMNNPNSLLQQVSAMAGVLPPSVMAAIRGTLLPGSTGSLSTQPSISNPNMMPSGGNNLMSGPSLSSGMNIKPQQQQQQQQQQPQFLMPPGGPMSANQNPFNTGLPAGATAHINPNFFASQGNFMSSVNNPSAQPNIFGLSNQVSGAVPSYPPPQAAPNMLMPNAGLNLMGNRNQASANVPGGGISELEFNEILDRNKTVSSSAVNRAVQDAANGDYGSAVETLVTAISLIKQSKIASDDRCRFLINSLQDTLHSIESKCTGSRRHRRTVRSSRRTSDSDSEPDYDRRGHDDDNYSNHSGMGYEDSYRHRESRRGNIINSSSSKHRRDRSRSPDQLVSLSSRHGRVGSRSSRERDFYSGSSSRNYSSRR